MMAILVLWANLYMLHFVKTFDFIEVIAKPADRNSNITKSKKSMYIVDMTFCCILRDDK